MQQSDEEIMRLYQSGDKDAMRHIFQRYKIRILNFCLGLLGNRSDAEEVAGNVFLALVTDKSSYDPSRTFSTWVYTIARYKCISQIRKRKSVLSLSPSSEDQDREIWDIPDTNDQPGKNLERKEVICQVRRAISKLPSEQKEAIILRQYHELSYQQISEVLGCSLEKVKILIFRAKEQLSIELASFIKEGQS